MVLMRVVVLIDSAYLSMNGVAIHGWNMPLVGKTSNKMYRIVLEKFLPSIDMLSIYEWKADIHGWGKPPIECNIH